jgi:hypothetical protein
MWWRARPRSSARKGRHQIIPISMLELGLLTFMILALATSLLMLRRRGAQAEAIRDSSA